MKNIKRISTAGTIICFISLILYIAAAIWLHMETSGTFAEFAGESMEKLEQIDANSPSAGYEAIAYLAGGALGILGDLFTFLIIYFLGFLALYQVPAIISGFLANRRYKNGYDMQKCLKSYKVDGFIKAIMNGIAVVIVILMIAGERGDASITDTLILLALVWNYIIVFILSIFQIKNIKTEEAKNVTIDQTER